MKQGKRNGEKGWRRGKERRKKKGSGGVRLNWKEKRWRKDALNAVGEIRERGNFDVREAQK